MSLALNFSAIVSPYGLASRKYKYKHDFVLLLENNPDFDRDTLRKLGDLVYVNGGKGILKRVRHMQSLAISIL